MLNDILKEAPGLVGRRFLINATFPSLVFWGLIIAIAIVGQGDAFNTLKNWNQQDNTLKTLQIIGFVTWVAFFSIILSSQLNTILRFYEGYWNFPLGRYFANNRKKWHQSHLKKLVFERQSKKLRRTLKLVDKALEESSPQSSSPLQQPVSRQKFNQVNKGKDCFKNKKNYNNSITKERCMKIFICTIPCQRNLKK
jgi:hypothetical protein